MWVRYSLLWKKHFYSVFSKNKCILRIKVKQPKYTSFKCFLMSCEFCILASLTVLTIHIPMHYMHGILNGTRKMELFIILASSSGDLFKILSDVFLLLLSIKNRQRREPCYLTSIHHPKQDHNIIQSDFQRISKTSLIQPTIIFRLYIQ